jgi:hypothetical protein
LIAVYTKMIPKVIVYQPKALLSGKTGYRFAPPCPTRPGGKRWM